MFELDSFIADCKAVMAAGGDQKQIRELMREAGRRTRPGGAGALASRKRPASKLLYRSEIMTVINGGVGTA